MASAWGGKSRCKRISLSPHSLPLCPEKFNKHTVSYQDLVQNPGLLDDPNLVVKINEK